MKFLGKLIVASIVLCSFSMSVNAQRSTSKETLIEFEDAQARMLDITSKAIFKPLVVELEVVGPKVTKVYEYDFLKLESLNNDPANLRSWATFKLATEKDCDVIVAATYDITYNSTAKKGKVTIVGYPANFKNWHSVNDGDLKWINELPSDLYKIPSVNPVNPVKTK